MKLSKIAASAGLLAVASLASAAVTFDSATGTGFVGKGDVQLAFGWNNSQLQANAGALAFSYSLTTRYAADCVWFTGPTRNRVRHEVSHTIRTSLKGAVVYEARQRNQVNGFNLLGFGETSSVGTVPVVGGDCQGEGAGGTWESVEQLSETSDALEVTYGSTTVPLTITPPVVL